MHANYQALNTFMTYYGSNIWTGCSIMSRSIAITLTIDIYLSTRLKKLIRGLPPALKFCWLN